MQNRFYQFIFILFISLISMKSHAQVDVASLTCKKWKLDQFYVNKVRFDGQNLDSLKFEYLSNGIVRIYRKNKSDYGEMHYTANADSLIVSNGTAIFRYKLVYLNKKFLVYTNRFIDSATNNEVEAEFRFIPL